MLNKIKKIGAEIDMMKYYKIAKRCILSTHKEFLSYTFTNTPLPPLNEVPTKRSSI